MSHHPPRAWRRPANVTLVGIVGKIGAGKSTVARMLADHGARVVDADRLAHEVLGEAPVRDALRRRFGADVFAADGSVDRRALARRVFGPDSVHAAALADLEAIVHPRVHERIRGAIGDAAREEPGGVVVLDVPLLVQSGWHGVCDTVVLLQCDDAVRRARVAPRFSPDQIAAREAAWGRHPPEGLSPAKTRTVDTSGDPSYTRAQIDRIWEELVRRDP